MKTLRKCLIPLAVAVLAIAIGVFAAACSGAVGYKVEVYLENVLSEENSYTDSGEAGQQVIVTAREIEGYVFDDTNEQNVTALTLDKDESKNVFHLYYKAEGGNGEQNPPGPAAEKYTVTYASNLPLDADAQGATPATQTDESGNFTVAQNGFSARGYRFAGWAESLNGAVVYAPGDSAKATSDITLYAVWDRAKTDRFGGADLLYFPSDDEHKAVLERGGVEFEGERDGNNFRFEVSEDFVLDGRSFGNTFTMRRPALKGSYVYYNSYYIADGSSPFDYQTTLEVDEYGSATYTYVDPDTGRLTTAEGSVVYNEVTEEYMFTDNRNATGLVYTIETRVDPSKTGADRNVPVFMSTNYEGGRYYQFLTGDGMNGSMGQYDLLLDGYGSITFYDFIDGGYRIEYIYDNGMGELMYKVEAVLYDTYGLGILSDLGISPDGTGAYHLYFYTLPMNDGTYSFVSARSERGEYTNADAQAELVLDGFGNLPDSLSYTVNGVTLNGVYTIEQSPRERDVTYINFTVYSNGIPTQQTRRFRIESNGTFTEVVSASGGYSEYVWLTDSTFKFSPLLVISGENYTEDETVLGKKADVYIQLADLSYVLGGSGYVSEEQLHGGYITMSQFIRTTVTPGYDESVPEQMKFLMESTYDSNYIPRNVYFVFELNHVKQYTEVAEQQPGTAKLLYNDIGGNLTFGSLYIDENGDYFSGGLTMDNVNYAFGEIGVFAYYNARGELSYYFMEFTYDGDSRPIAFRRVSGTETALCLMSESGAFNTMATMIMRGTEVLYSPSGNFDDPEAITRGTVSFLGETEFGDTVNGLVNSRGTTEFRFITGFYNYVEFGVTTRVMVYYVYNSGVAGEYTAADGGKLLLDGYYKGRYTTSDGDVYNGTYRLDGDDVIRFVSEGREFVFETDGSSFEKLDPVYGSFNFTVHGETFTLVFDGHSVVEVRNRVGRLIDTGYYEISEGDRVEVVIFADFGEGPESYTLTFDSTLSEFISLNSEMYGTFVSDNWAVLSLDGYGNGVYYSADGRSAFEGRVIMIDSETRFAMLQSRSFANDVYFNLNTQNGTFTIPEYFPEVYMYFTESLVSVAFDPNGNATVNNVTGVYNIVGDNVNVYTQSAQTGAYVKKTLPKPTGADEYVWDGKTFYRFETEDRQMVLQGTILIDEPGYENITGATLAFTVDSAEINTNAVFTVNGVSYNMILTNFYLDSETNMRTERTMLFDTRIYAYYPIQISFIPGRSTNTFTADGGLISTTYTCYSEANSSITEEYVGFGPIQLTSITARGSVHTDSGQLTFTNGKVYAVGYEGDAVGFRYMVVFQSGGTNYSMTYYKETDNQYTLYWILTYNELQSGSYTVGVGNYLYNNSDFEFSKDYAVGEFCSVTLFETVNGEKMAVQAVEWGINDKLNLNGDAGKCTSFMVRSDDEKRAYYFDFTMTDGKATAVTVTEYGFKQAMIADGTVILDFLLNDSGEPVMLVGMLQLDSESYYMNATLITSGKQNGNIWTATDADGYIYTIEIMQDSLGDYLESHDGYWLVEIDRAVIGS